MAVIVSIFRTDNYDRLREVLEQAVEHAPGSHIRLHRADDDPHEVLIEVEVDTVNQAKGLMAEEHYLREFFDLAGLDFYPPTFLGEMVEEFGDHPAKASGPLVA